MFLARIDGCLHATKKHELLTGVRFLIARRLDSEGVGTGDPIVLADPVGARQGTTVLVSTDGEITRKWLGNTVPARLVVAGIVDAVHTPAGARP